MPVVRTTLLAIALALPATVALGHARPVSHHHNGVAVITLGKTRPAGTKAPHARIDVRVRDRTTQVWVDGVYRGTAAELARRKSAARLQPGVRRVRLVLPDGTAAAREIPVAPRTVVRLGIDLR